LASAELTSVVTAKSDSSKPAVIVFFNMTTIPQRVNVLKDLLGSAVNCSREELRKALCPPVNLEMPLQFNFL
jgi:hypothetical protein